MDNPESDQYVDMAEQYTQTKVKDHHTDAFEPTIKKIIENLEVTNVIDLACGTGWLTRMLRSKATGKVTGMDLSQDMLD